MITVKCFKCGREVLGRQNRKTICPECRDSPRPCSVCGKVFKPGHFNCRVCSNACRLEQSRQRSARNEAKKKHRIANNLCMSCGASLAHKGPQAKRCDECIAERNRKYQRDRQRELRSLSHKVAENKKTVMSPADIQAAMTPNKLQRVLDKIFEHGMTGW